MNKQNQVFALYLPQFHRIPENDLWWGEGFTEWNNVKAAKSLYKGHLQPQIPLDGYYDLKNADILDHQAKLAHKYGIQGFCFYHYYSIGKLLLEKPAENLLNRKDIDIEFLFSWANHDWRRTWYKFNNEILFEQKYGNADQLRAHYRYLREFFLDPRYKKIDNKPVFIIYRTDLVPNFPQMKAVWEVEAIKDGFAGIYFVSTVTGIGVDQKAVGVYDAFFDFEPDAIIAEQLSIVKRKILLWRAKLIPRFNKVSPWKCFRQRFTYEQLMLAAQKKKIDHKGMPYIRGIFARWDNTPRHVYNARLILGSSPELFRKFLEQKLALQEKNALPIMIVNSWNEWSEGSNIEPNDVDKYSYLQVIKEVLNDSEISSC